MASFGFLRRVLRRVKIMRFSVLATVKRWCGYDDEYYRLFPDTERLNSWHCHMHNVYMCTQCTGEYDALVWPAQQGEFCFAHGKQNCDQCCSVHQAITIDDLDPHEGAVTEIIVPF